MARTITVISPDVDGARLRRWKANRRYYLRYDGTRGNHEINEAIQNANKGMRVTMPWRDGQFEQIFGTKVE